MEIITSMFESEFWERSLIKNCVVARLAKRGGGRGGVLGAVTNKSCAFRDWRGFGWIGGCKHGGEGSFPRKSNESLWII